MYQLIYYLPAPLQGATRLRRSALSPKSSVQKRFSTHIHFDVTNTISSFTNIVKPQCSSFKRFPIPEVRSMHVKGLPKFVERVTETTYAKPPRIVNVVMFSFALRALDANDDKIPSTSKLLGV